MSRFLIKEAGILFCKLNCVVAYWNRQQDPPRTVDIERGWAIAGRQFKGSGVTDGDKDWIVLSDVISG